VLHNGYGGGLICIENENIEPLPFILVEASRVDDTPIIRRSEEDRNVKELEEKIYKSVLAKERLENEILINLWGCLIADDVSYEMSVDELLSPLLPPLDAGIESSFTTESQSQELQAINNSLASWTDKSALTVDDQRRQIFSFAASSIAVPGDKPVNEVLPLLRRMSTRERLAYAYKKLKKNQSWLSIFSIL
jgi:hypothetical protein